METATILILIILIFIELSLLFKNTVLKLRTKKNKTHEKRYALWKYSILNWLFVEKEKDPMNFSAKSVAELYLHANIATEKKVNLILNAEKIDEFFARVKTSGFYNKTSEEIFKEYQEEMKCICKTCLLRKANLDLQ